MSTLPGTLNFLTRADWQAAAPTRDPQPVPAPDRLGVAVHWEGTTVAQPDHSGCAGLVRQIQHYHQAAHGWSDIAYSFVICQHGVVFKGRGWSWDQFANGTTTDAALEPDSTGYANWHWYSAVVLIGEGEEPTQAAVDALARVVRRARGRGAGSRVVPHRDFHPTDCPGDTLAAVAHKWDRAAIHTGEHRPTTPPPPVHAAPDGHHHHHRAAPSAIEQLAARLDTLEATVTALAAADKAAGHALDGTP